jgi:hypothetical protein
MKDATIAEIERINLMILVIGSVASIFIMREFKYFFSFAVASAMMTANFRLIRKILTSAFSAATIQKRELVKLPLKFLALAVLVALVMIYGDIDILFFMIGLSTVFLSLVIHQIVLVFRPRSVREET